MPITLRQLATNGKQVTFPYAGESVTVTYAPDQVTSEFQARMLDAAKTVQSDAALPELLHLVDEALVRLVKEWDVLLDVNGPAVPLTVEAVAPLPIYFKVAVLKHIFEDMSPGETRAATPKPRSVATSRRKAGSTSSPTA